MGDARAGIRHISVYPIDRSGIDLLLGIRDSSANCMLRCDTSFRKSVIARVEVLAILFKEVSVQDQDGNR